MFFYRSPITHALMSKKLRYLLNALVSIVLMALIIHVTGAGKIVSHLAALSLPLFLLAVLIENAGVMVSAKKWHLLLDMKGAGVPFLAAWKYYYIGTFFNAFFPTTVGGDAVKAYGLSRRLPRREDAFSSVIMDRLTGLLAVLAIGILSLAGGWSLLSRTALLLSAVILLLPLALVLVVFGTDVVGRLLHTSLAQKLGRLALFVEEVYVSLRTYGHSRRRLLPVMAISLVYHMLLVVNNYVLSLALGLDIPLYYFFIFIPVAEILVFLPVSIQGFGVREGTYVTLFSAIGVGSGPAFALGFSDQLVKLIGNLIGGVVYAATGWRD